ncbi:MAG: class poly(R)-hydroxyalkanoic acid synthase, partial [Rhizobacter sp.]|nr:class poly(R)-hydroxyalkanoic acid synthase [Rhizobacter sp.]
MASVKTPTRPRRAPAKSPSRSASKSSTGPSAKRAARPLAVDEPHTERASVEQSQARAGAARPGHEKGHASAFPGLPPIPGIPPIPVVPPVDLASLGKTFESLAGLTVAPNVMLELQTEYLSQATALWNQALGLKPLEPTPPPSTDRRFTAPEWNEQPASSFTAAMYLLNARTLTRLADSIEGDVKTRQRIRFAVEQFVSAASPSNVLALNPQALKLAVETQGQSLAQGMSHLWHDLQQGHMSQTDESVFEVGRNVANTEGAVVFENELFQLLEYKPLTGTVFERPLVMVPPCINKYYILDLQPDNSLVAYAVAQGHTVFLVSWRNIGIEQSGLVWDDYVERGVLKAIDVACAISGSKQLNTLGFCLGGTLLGSALAVAAARGEQPAASVTLLTTMLDFSDTGEL